MIFSDQTDNAKTRAICLAAAVKIFQKYLITVFTPELPSGAILEASNNIYTDVSDILISSLCILTFGNYSKYWDMGSNVTAFVITFDYMYVDFSLHEWCGFCYGSSGKQCRP